MIIRSFEVSPDHTVTLEMGQMPPQAKRANTTIEIGGIAQAEPDLVSFTEQQIVFSAGPASQQGTITVTVSSGRSPLTATSVEPYMTLEPDPENDAKAVILSVFPTKAKPGDAVTVRGRNLKNVTELYIGLVRIQPFNPSETSARITVPPTARAGMQVIRFKDGKFSGAVEQSTKRLEVTAAGEG